MSLVDALFQEARDALTPWASVALILVIGVSRALVGKAHRRMTGTVGLFALHVIVLVVTAALFATQDALEDGASPAARREVLEALRARMLERNYIVNLLSTIERERTLGL